MVYARILSHSNIVLVPRSAMEPLATPYDDLRDRQIIAFTPELVDVIEITNAAENFTVRQDASGAWKAGDQPADPAYVAWWLGQLVQLEATNFVRDVVNDFAPYGLAPGQRQYTLRTLVTNATGVTNVLIARLAFGTNGASDTVYARRWDEDSVYAIRPLDYTHMPAAAWQFREHRLWNFTTNQVVRMAVKQGDSVREILRQPGGAWVPVRGWTSEPNPFAMEEIARSLGELTAVMWMARGDAARAQYGFDANSPQLIVGLAGDKTLTVEFGDLSPWRLPYALATVDGQPTVFEFPWQTFASLQSYFNLRVAAPRTAR
jgi:hypothetical protein